MADSKNQHDFAKQSKLYLYTVFINIGLNSYTFIPVENTANQNTGKPLYISLNSTQPSHRALRSFSRLNLVIKTVKNGHWLKY